MATRTGMANLIAELRVLTDTVDITNDALVDFGIWTDEALQAVLDMTCKSFLNDIPLIPTTNLDNETLRYHIPLPANSWVEQDGTLTFLVDSTGTVVLDSHTIDYNTNTVVFDADTNGIEYNLRGVAYAMYDAAADVWQKKMSLRSSMIHVKAGSHTLHEEQEYEHCKERYMFFKGSRLQHSRMRRADYAVY